MNSLIACNGCGCTDEDPCIDLAGQPCRWTVVNEEVGAGLCSVCAARPLQELINPLRIEVVG